MQNQKQSNTNNQFLQLPYDLLSATGYVGKGGVVVPITLQQKIIYCWMKQRCEFFAQDKREYFDNVDDIAESVKINRKTVMGAIKTFTDTGVLVASKKALGGNRAKWVFKRFSELVLIQPEQKAEKAVNAPAVSVPDDAVPAGADWACEAVPLDAYAKFNPDEEDDGSAGDAFAYEAFEALPATKEEKPIIVKATAKTAGAVHFDDMPMKRYHPSGRVSDEMMVWCKDKNITHREGEFDIYWTIQGKDYVLNQDEFIQCSSKPVASRPTLEDFEGLF